MGELQIIKHNDILFRDLLRGIAVKNVAWPHPIESQVKWIIDNMRPNDLHVFLRMGELDKAYMTLSPVYATVNGVEIPFMGVGCVCSANPGMGGGKSLVIGVNDYLVNKNCKGILFCKKEIIGFYSKYNWKIIEPERVHFNEPHDGVFTMVYNCENIQSLEYTDRLI